MSGAEWNGKMPEGDAPLVETTMAVANVVWLQCPVCWHIFESSERRWADIRDGARVICLRCGVTSFKSDWDR